jgi:hypothetical protein
VEKENNAQEVNAARELLKKNGYFVDNLWHTRDIQTKFNVQDDVAYNVLSVLLDSDYHKERVNQDISDTGKDMGLPRI